MAKESSPVIKVCDFIIKYSIYAAIFLMPIFFLPWTADVLDFNKQSLLILLGFVALFAWMLRALLSGKFAINSSKTHIVAGILFLIYLLATIFSTNRYGSFWGWPQIASESLLSLIGLLIFYFLVSNAFSKQNIFTGAIILFISAFIAELAGVLQLLKLFIIPFDFAKSVSFNTIGTAGSLGFFAAILLPLAIIMLIISKKWWKVLFVLEIILSGLLLFLVNYSVIWWAVFAGSALAIIFGIINRKFFDGRWLALPMFFLAVSLFFVLLNPQISWMSQKTNEIFLSQKTSFDISLQAAKVMPFLGSGPGTFAYDFLKFKDPIFSQSSLWNVIFNQASSKVLNDLASTGVLGLLAFLALIIFSVFYAAKFLISKKSEKNWILLLGMFCSLIVCAVTYFLYNSNITLSFIFFFLIAGLANLTAENKKEYELSPSSFTTLAVTFIFTLLFIFGLGLLILDGQRYVAEINYYKGLALWQKGNQPSAIKSLETAASLNSSSDLYFVQLSQAYLLNLQNEIQNTKGTPSDAEKNKIQALFANSVNAAVMATNLNPNSSSDWANRGYIYQTLNGLMGDLSTWALASYGTALKLDPNNPYLFSQEGTVNFVSSSALGQDKADQKTQLLEVAKNQLEKAVALNPNYSNALYFLGLVYDALGQKNQAIQEFTKVQKLNPNDTTIPKILNNLNAGFPALQQAPPPVTTPPTANSSPDNTVKNPPIPAKTKK